MGADARDIILQIYTRRMEALDAGRSPERVVMSMEAYRALQEFHAMLGELPDGMDYLGRYRVFDLEICVEAGSALRVE